MSDVAAFDGAPSSTWSYAYDSAGRLTQAVLAAHDSTPAVTYGYGYAATGGCGADPGAGLDGARSTASVQVATSTPTTTTSCTDYASRLTSTSATGTATYNTHGDATSIGGQSFTYDASDRVVAGTGTGGGQTIAYTRDATGRIVTRMGTGSGAGADTSSSVYAYTGDGDSADLQLTSAGTILERYLSLPGGVLYTKGYANPGDDNWALPNIHGDTLTTTTSMTIAIYDPVGNPIDPTTGLADLANTLATRTNDLTDAWLGQYQRATEYNAGASWTLMGARIYLPGLGQFTTLDPVEGGVDNAYTYPLDPVNQLDITGLMRDWSHRYKKGAQLSDWAIAHRRGIATTAAFVGLGVCAFTTGLGCALATAAGAAAAGFQSYYDCSACSGGRRWGHAALSAGVSIGLGQAFGAWRFLAVAGRGTEASLSAGKIAWQSTEGYIARGNELAWNSAVTFGCTRRGAACP